MAVSVLKILRYLAVLCGLVFIAGYDRRERRIPNRMLAVLLAARGILLAVECTAASSLWEGLRPSVLGGLLGGGFFLFCHMISRKGIGAGDVKLMAVVGFYMGDRIWDAAVISLILAAVWSIGLLLRKRKGWKQEIPFAPFVLAGTASAILLEVGGII